MEGNYAVYANKRNLATSAIRKAESDFEGRIAEESKSNTKSLWRYIRSKTKVKTSVGDLRKLDGELTANDLEKAETLNQQYGSVFTRERGEIPDITEKPCLSDLKEMDISCEMVEKAIDKLKVDKSPGLDQIYPRVIKELKNELLCPIKQIFQKSLDEGKIPDAWRDAGVTPIFKKGSRLSPANYRPVSLTSIICKLMEAVLRDAIMKHLQDNHLLSDRQYGFRPKRSCALQLLEILDK
jgi:hypothetical protein